MTVFRSNSLKFFNWKEDNKYKSVRMMLKPVNFPFHVFGVHEKIA